MSPHRTYLKQIKGIKQTNVKDQAFLNYCWAYSNIGLLESNLIKKASIDIDLNEEALGFYRMAEELM